MPSTLTYPGVYVEEIPSGVRTISGVATSITAFVGSFPRGPRNLPVRLFNYGDFERTFGGLSADSEASYAIQQFFLNGGGQAYAVRVTNTDAGAGATARAASVVLGDGNGNAAMTVTAANEGRWGNALRVEVDYNTPTPATTFNLRVTEVRTVNGREEAGAVESFSNLLPGAALADVVAGASNLIRLSGIPTPALRPAATGTTTGNLTNAALTALTGNHSLEVTPQDAEAYTITLDLTPITRASALAAALQTALRRVVPAAPDAPDAFDLSRATVQVAGTADTEQRLVIRAGGDADLLTFADAGGDTLATDLGLTENVQRYALGSTVAAGAQGAGQAGEDGVLPGATDLMGSDAAPRSGIYALRDVDLFNILSIPDTMRLGDNPAGIVFAAATTLCEEERAFYILDVPQPPGNPRDRVEEMEAWMGDNGALRHRNVATYYPRPVVSDPLNGFLLRPIAASGTAAGLYARTDATRGVWKAPAGTDATLRGVQALEYRLTDMENGVLNPLGVNCLRTLPVFGRVLWGARTLQGADALASEWKYIPVRRLALFLEESLFRGLQWVVFEPNDEPLWGSIRLNVGAFMQSLFRQGAFQGTSAREAYFVKCDRETTTQTDVNMGVVNVVVGFAPLKPAEFVVLKIQQMAGQIET